MPSRLYLELPKISGDIKNIWYLEIPNSYDRMRRTALKELEFSIRNMLVSVLTAAH